MIKKYLPWAIVILVLLAMLQQCSDHKQEVKDKDKAARYAKIMYNSNLSTLETKVLKDKSTITSQQALLLDEKSANELLSKEVTRLKNIKSNVKVVTKTVVKDVIIPIETIINVDSSGKKDTIRSFSMRDEWVYFSGSITDSSVILDSALVNNQLTITIGEKGNGS